MELERRKKQISPIRRNISNDETHETNLNLWQPVTMWIRNGNMIYRVRRNIDSW